jgi:type II secretion system protein I
MAANRVTERRQGGPRRERGFTLIEVMVAMLLTALTVIGVLGLFRVETRASQFSRRSTEAAVLAQDKLEELRTDTAPSGAIAETSETPWDYLKGADSMFTRKWTIDPTLDAAVFRITVVVSWEEDGIPRQVEVSGLRGSS